ncbi:MAG: sulfatase-like hydrolase/transferase [Planctomycetota bacterium]
MNLNIRALLSVLAVVIVVADTHAQHDDRPNFLLITSEDMSPDLGCYGDPVAITPNLDALARRGNRYTSAFATGPICSPARTALLFSRYQTSLGAGNHRSTANTPAELVGFASHLRDAGYFCTNSPKVDYNSSRIWEIERATYDRGRDWRESARDGRPFLSIINIDVSHQSYTSVLPFEEYRTRVRNKLPADWIRDPADVIVPPYFPDTPAVRKELARYADCVSLMDMRAGEILAKLDEDGLSDSTIVMYFSDHGAGHPRHKSTPFASGLRVPMIIYCPPRFEHLLRAPRGDACEDIVSFVDIGPTLLRLAGVDVPPSMHGVPFLGADAQPREFAVGALDRRAESFHLARTVTDGRYVYIRSFMPHVPFGQPKGYGFPSAIYQELKRLGEDNRLPPAAADYLKPHAPELLFDLHSDPYETANLATREQDTDTINQFRSELRSHLSDIGDFNFLPEEELVRRGGTGAWTEAVAPELLETIKEAASLVGGDEAVLPRQLELATHDDPAVRWWATIGLRNSKTANADTALISGLQDESPLVQTESAASCIERGLNKQQARTVLLSATSSDNPLVAYRAARYLQLSPMRDSEALAAVQNAATTHSTEMLREVAAAMRRDAPAPGTLPQTK